MEEPPSPQSPSTSPPPGPVPVMDVVPPPTAAAVQPADTKDPPKLPVPKTTLMKPITRSQSKKPASESVNTAIAATVVIVLGLALLAVYAYLAQKR